MLGLQRDLFPLFIVLFHDFYRNILWRNCRWVKWECPNIKYSTPMLYLVLKGQSISKWPSEIKVSSKIPTKLSLDFCPEIFCTFLGASWKLYEASCRLPCLWYYIVSPQGAQKASRKPTGSYKKNQGRKPEIISLVFWMKLIFHKDSLKLTDL